MSVKDNFESGSWETTDFDNIKVYTPSHEPKLHKCTQCGSKFLGVYNAEKHNSGFLSECFIERVFEKGD